MELDNFDAEWDTPREPLLGTSRLANWIAAIAVAAIIGGIIFGT